jgi:predicted acetyltransferase
MKIELVKVEESQKSVLRQMLELYEYEFSKFNGNDINGYGFFGYRYFDHYWTEPERYAFFIKINGNYAGFAMVNDFCYVLKAKAKTMAEFFIMLKYRRLGAGSMVAAQIFDMFPGDWEVLQHGKNEISKLFWENVVEKYTNNNYMIKAAITEEWEGQALIFNNMKEPAGGSHRK